MLENIKYAVRDKWFIFVVEALWRLGKKTASNLLTFIIFLEQAWEKLGEKIREVLCSRVRKSIICRYQDGI